MAIVVTGAGRAFCAGADVQRLESGDMTEFRQIYEAFLRGLNLALACDLRIASPSARFVPRFPQIGPHPGGGHIWMLQRVVGSETTAAMLPFGAELDGEEAVRRGLAWRSVDCDILVDAAVELASTAVRISLPLSVRIKQSRRLLGAVTDHEAAIEIELEAQAWSAQQSFFRESLAAFAEHLAARRDNET